MTLSKAVALLVFLDVLIVSSCLSPRNYDRIYRPCDHQYDYLDRHEEYMYEDSSRYNFEYKKDWIEE